MAEGGHQSDLIVPVDDRNLPKAAIVHSISWKESHRTFCTPEFVEQHTPERQTAYLRGKMDGGSRFFLLTEEKTLGIVSVNGSLIEDLYVLPERQRMGYGTELLRFAIRQCPDTPTLWILENNRNAERLYRRMGFQPTGRVHAHPEGLSEIEFALA